MTNFKKKIDNGIVTLDFESFPKELGNSWIFIHEFKNHPFYSYLFSMYHNDDFPKGTIVVSPFFYHKYPDIYSLYSKKTDKNIYLGERASVNPKYRGQTWWIWYAYMTRVIFWDILGIVVDITPDRNKKMEAFYQKYTTQYRTDEDNIENNGRMNYPSEEMPRDPAFPYIWYNNRISAKNKKEIV